MPAYFEQRMGSVRRKEGRERGREGGRNEEMKGRSEHHACLLLDLVVVSSSSSFKRGGGLIMVTASESDGRRGFRTVELRGSRVRLRF